MIKSARKRGVKPALAKAYADIMRNGQGNTTKAQGFEEGEKAKLNVEALKARKNYSVMTDAYREFVEDNTDTIFTVHKEHENIISLSGYPQWLFWSGDLLKADCEQVVEANENT